MARFFHLAQVHIARMRAPIGDPLMPTSSPSSTP
jgi:hypothetical protein